MSQSPKFDPNLYADEDSQEPEQALDINAEDRQKLENEILFYV